MAEIVGFITICTSWGAIVFVFTQRSGSSLDPCQGNLIMTSLGHSHVKSSFSNLTNILHTVTFDTSVTSYKKSCKISYLKIQKGSKNCSEPKTQCIFGHFQKFHKSACHPCHQLAKWCPILTFGHTTPHSLLGKIELFTSCNLCAQCIKLPLPPAPAAPPRATGAPVITKTQFSLNMTNDHNLGPFCSAGAHYANFNRKKQLPYKIIRV